MNLGGHTISGTNAPGGEGIANDGHPGVRILGGRITDFRLNGVGMRARAGASCAASRSGGSAPAGIEGEPVSAGIAIVDSPGSQIAQNDVSNDVAAYQSDGADVLNSPGSSVQANSLSHNNWNGLVLIESADSQVIGNGLDANGNNGTEVNGASDGAWIARPTSANGNTNIGIVVGSATGLHVVGNSATGNDTGLFFFDLHDSLITLNSASGNRDGIDLAGRPVRLGRQPADRQRREPERLDGHRALRGRPTTTSWPATWPTRTRARSAKAEASSSRRAPATSCSRTSRTRTSTPGIVVYEDDPR